MIIKRIYPIFFSLLLISACSQEADQVFIEDELNDYFLRFQAEAALRGITVDFDQAQIEGYLDDIEIENASGACQQGEPSFILVDRDWWAAADDLEKEFLIFHELGHCFLLREHLDTQDDDGVCLSMMHSTSTVCDNQYDLDTRDEYLDELFQL